jgi:hypothetical protein
MMSPQNCKAILRIKSLAQYKLGWYDGILGKPASNQTILDALNFASCLDLSVILYPFISLDSDGNIDFWWDYPTVQLGLGFYGDKTYSYFGKLFVNNCKFYGDDVPIICPLPEELLMALHKGESIFQSV